METEMNRDPADAIKGNVDKIARDVGGMVNEASGVLKDYGAKKLETAKQTLSTAQTYVQDGYKQAADVTDQYVQSNPWRAVGIAAAAGVLLGLLIRR
jgi:ElaB/YqjD/DUF883 family membrane-anchored ribosome-binding protein